MYTELFSTLPAKLTPLALPAASDRRVWDGIPQAVRDARAAQGEALLGRDWGGLSAADYLAFTRTGDRAAFENKYFPRRRDLDALVLAECCQHQGRFLDDIANGVWAICEESGWQLPAHNSYVRDAPARPLPDAERPVLDLFACETGAILALIPLLLGPELDAVSPALCTRIRSEVERRVVKPYLNEHFWWMGDKPTCNWTPWCTQNALIAVLATGQSQEVMRRAVELAGASLDSFLEGYGDDGCCEEGALYYRHSALTLYGATEVLNSVSKGHYMSLYETEKMKNIAAYIVNVHVDGDFYLNYADCGPKPGRCGIREFLFGLSVSNAPLVELAAKDCLTPDSQAAQEEISLFVKLLELSNLEFAESVARNGYACGSGGPGSAVTLPIYDASHPPAPALPPDTFYPSTGLWIARDRVWCAACRAGNNGGSHGHNDAGSLILYRNGRPLLIDIGVESYTAKTFSPQRYDLWTMRSDWHNLPTLGGVLQQNGAEFGATRVEHAFGDAESRISMELSTAYPGVTASYRRTLVLAKGGDVTVEDVSAGPAVLSLLFCEKPVWDGGVLTAGDAGAVAVTGGGAPTVEAVPIADPRLRQGWPDTLYRVQIAFTGTLSLRFAR